MTNCRIEAQERELGRLMAKYSREEWMELFRYFDDVAAAEREHVVKVIAGHLPGLAPAILALAEHAMDDVESGCCGVSLMEAPPRWAEVWNPATQAAKGPDSIPGPVCVTVGTLCSLYLVGRRACRVSGDGRR